VSRASSVIGSPSAADLDRHAFAARFGGVVEGASWVVEAAWEARPFADLPALAAAFITPLERAGPAVRLKVLRAHPELAGSAALADLLSPESEREQAAAGLDRLAAPARGRLLTLTSAYRERFGYPFVICVREHSLEGIFAAAERRLRADPVAEQAEAMGEVAAIVRARLTDLNRP
jgi:OHCU decarboxylase